MQLKKFSQSAQKVLIQCRAIAKKHQSLSTEPEHLALALMMTTELKELLSKKEKDHKALSQSLLYLIDGMPKGLKTDPPLSLRLVQALSLADAMSISKGHDNIYISDLFLSLMENREKYGALGSLLTEFFFKPEKRAQKLKEEKTGDSILDGVSDNINALIKDELSDQIFDRKEELERLIQVLSRKKRNNPLLIGEPGVGRTSIVYSLAKHILAQDVPAHLVNKEILSLDVSLLIAGTTLRGQFEERMSKLLSELSKKQGHYILFIRDLSSLMGAGGEGAMDAANLLMPGLMSGALQIIGLVTPSVYKKRIEAHPSFERYFQPLWIEQPSRKQCQEILLGLKDNYQRFHGLFIDDDAVDAAIDLSVKHLFDGVLPELALDALDEACSRHRIAMDKRPAVLEGLSQRITQLQIDAMRKPASKKKLAELKRLKAELTKKDQSYEKELSMVESLRALSGEMGQLRSQLRQEERRGDIKKAFDISEKGLDELSKEFARQKKQLSAIKKSDRFIDPWVRRDDIAEVISLRTGIPVSKMIETEREKLSAMEKILGDVVIGQEQAISAVANAIRRSRVGLKDQKRPIGSFLFLGPTGVGKTELARALTNFLFDDERAMVRFDMSEFMERHSVARLLGSPPGYQGSQEGGQLTERIRRKPYSVVLFDEIEKAHVDVLNVLLQVLDEGHLTDSKGQLVKFSNTVVIMTSNIGADILLSPKRPQGVKELRQHIMQRLLNVLRPELLNRIDEIVIFNAIDRKGLVGIADLMLSELKGRMLEQGITLSIDAEVKRVVLEEGFNPEFGARPLKRAIQRLIENPLAELLLKESFAPGDAIEASLVNGQEIRFHRGK